MIWSWPALATSSTLVWKWNDHCNFRSRKTRNQAKRMEWRKKMLLMLSKPTSLKPLGFPPRTVHLSSCRFSECFTKFLWTNINWNVEWGYNSKSMQLFSAYNPFKCVTCDVIGGGKWQHYWKKYLLGANDSDYKSEKVGIKLVHKF
jgi:hypothetical protein